MILDGVLKVGGSLSRSTGLAALCNEIGRLGERYRLLIVPGGGSFADQVRFAYKRYDLSETTAHFMALLAMDQFGYVLNRLIPDSILIADPSDWTGISETGKTCVLLPSKYVAQCCPLPHSWDVTSDSISAWIASQTDCGRLVLLKDVDGLLRTKQTGNAPGELIGELTVDQLEVHEGGVDKYLSRFLATVNLNTWVINGLRPERLVALLETNYTIGTRIRCR